MEEVKKKATERIEIQVVKVTLRKKHMTFVIRLHTYNTVFNKLGGRTHTFSVSLFH